MKNLLIFLKVLLVFICVSCKNSEIEENIYTSKDEISEVGDSIFFSSGFSDIKYYKDKLFVSEVKSDRVLIFDNKFKLLQIVGKTGSGPGELRSPTKLFISNDTLFVYDDINNRINIYDINGNYLKQIILEKGVRIRNEFVVYDSKIYVSTSTGSYPISIFDLNGKLVNQFGIWIPTSSVREKIERNMRNLAIDNQECLISVLISEPIVEKYNLSGELIYKLDLSSLQYLEKRLKKVRETQERDKLNLDRKGISVSTLFPEIYLDKNKIFLLCTTQLKENLVEYSSILEIVNKSNELYPVQIIKLDPHSEKDQLNWYLSFCVVGDQIFASDTRKYNLVKFER